MTEPFRIGAGVVVRVLEEVGLVNLYHVHHDVKILCLQRFVRLFAYGGTTLILVAYLQLLGISKTAIGLFMTLTLAGDVAISFFLTMFADAMGRKIVLGIGATLMAASGAIFATSANFWVLLAAAVFGVISPSGNEIGPFRAIEESVVAHLTHEHARSDVYAWYSLLGTAGTAFGTMVCGWVIHALTAPIPSGAGWPLVEAYRSIFYGYSLLGVFKLCLVMLLSRDVEVDGGLKEEDVAKNMSRTVTSEAVETTPLLVDNNSPGADAADETEETGTSTSTATPSSSSATAQGDETPPKARKGGFRAISKESTKLVISLCLMLGLDSLGSGLVALSWISFFFRSVYNLDEGRLGSIFFTTSIISAVSMLVASSIAKRFGNVKTMVFTHLPSSIFLALIPVFNNINVSVIFLVLRSCTSCMDVAPRIAFLAAIIPPEERTAIMGLINVIKTIAQSVGPFITGALADNNLFWMSFVAAGSLKVIYDIGMLTLFESHDKSRRRQQKNAVAANEEEAAV